MKIVLRNPRREVEMAGPLAVGDVLARLDVNREAVLVIVDGALVTGDAVVDDSATLEIRPVISGGAG